MKRYLKGKIHIDTLNNGTDKAFYVNIDDGRYSSRRNQRFWIPRSVCEIDDKPNDVGWCKILIPEWIFTRARLDYHRVLEINFGYSGESLYVIR